jgi:glutathione reductase (NADPH)
MSNPCVYAAGDAVLPPGSLPLTPVAAHEGLIVAANLLHGNTRRPDYRGIPSVVFTTPPLARVGMTESEARRQGLDFRVSSEDTTTWFTNRHVRETTGRFKTLVENGTHRVLGAHLLGRHADEVINLFALAIRHDLDARALGHMIYSYPTSGSDVVYMV